jgi:transcriptional regulator with XRE-family HTH domain
MEHVPNTPQMKLKLARIARSMNQTEVADLLRVSTGNVSRIETGKQIPTLEQAVVIEKAFGIAPAEWIEAARSAA